MGTESAHPFTSLYHTGIASRVNKESEKEREGFGC
jgi:hypothetical protein